MSSSCPLLDNDFSNGVAARGTTPASLAPRVWGKRLWWRALHSGSHRDRQDAMKIPNGFSAMGHGNLSIIQCHLYILYHCIVVLLLVLSLSLLSSLSSLFSLLSSLLSSLSSSLSFSLGLYNIILLLVGILHVYRCT